MNKNNKIPIATKFVNASNFFKQQTGAEEATPITGDPFSVVERTAQSRPAIRGKNYNKNTKIPIAEKVVSKITLYNSNDSRIKNVKFRGIDVIDTGKTLKTMSGVKLFRLEYGNNVNNQEFGTYIYMAEWVGGGIDGTTIDVTEKVVREMNELEEQDQMNQINPNRNGGKKTKKRKVKKNKNKRKKRKTIRRKL